MAEMGYAYKISFAEAERETLERLGVIKERCELHQCGSRQSIVEGPFEHDSSRFIKGR